MPKLAKELGALAVSRLASPGMHFVGAVPGLALHITDSGAKSWILRVVVAGKRREMGLGGYPAVTLGAAREGARQARDSVRKGVDPIQEQREAQSALRAAAAAALTFDECAQKYIVAHEAGWRNLKHGAQWRSTLETYAGPVLGKLLVRDVALSHVMQVLEPIWKVKNETASRVRSRIELVLDWATARGFREGPNPARWRGHLDKLLAAPAKLNKVKHHRALPYPQMSEFMPRLRACEGNGARALEFAILTAARSGEVRGATWAEIDKVAKSWLCPGNRMKAGRDHRVPLSDAALRLLNAMERGKDTDPIFPAPKGGQLSDMTLTAVLRRLQVEAVPHGFRSTFRDWAAEATSYPNEMAEMALAHTIDNKAEAAYRRGDLLERRRQMMADWATFISMPAAATSTVVRVSRRKKA